MNIYRYWSFRCVYCCWCCCCWCCWGFCCWFCSSYLVIFLCFIILSPLHGFHPSFLILSIWSTGICKAQHVNLVPNWHTTPVLIIVILPFHIKINFLYDTLHRSVPKHSDTKMSWTKRASRKGTFKLSKINHNTNFIKFHSKMLEIDENIFTV